MLQLMDSNPLVMSEEQSEMAYRRGMLHLKTYAYLRSLSSTSPRGGLNKNMWLMMPKHHHIQKMLRTMRAERVNPHWYSLLTAESFVGLIAKLTRKLGTHILFFVGRLVPAVMGYGE